MLVAESEKLSSIQNTQKRQGAISLKKPTDMDISSMLYMTATEERLTLILSVPCLG